MTSQVDEDCNSSTENDNSEVPNVNSNALTVQEANGRKNGHANGTHKPLSVAFSPDTAIFDDDDGDEAEVIEKTACDKFTDYLFCRGDLARKTFTTKPVPFLLLFRYSTTFDYFLLFIGVTGAVLSGFCQPSLSLMAGAFMEILLESERTENGARSDEFVAGAKFYIGLYFGLGVIGLIIHFLQFFCFHHVCCRLMAKLRHEYMRSLLRQNAGWYDRNQCGVLTTQLNDNIERIRDGIGDKLGLLIRGFSMFFAALVIAFIYEWRIALVMAPLAVINCAVMSLMSRKTADATSRELRDVGDAGASAEEAVLGVRTVQAFNGQKQMVERYRSQLSNGLKHALSKSIWSGTLNGFFFVMLITFMGGGMLLGAHLVSLNIIKEPGNVLTAVLSMLIGSYFLGLISPHLMSIMNARVAASIIYKTIDRVPVIDVYSEEGRKLENVVGTVELRNIHFRYPTRKEVKVLDGLNLKIEEGTTVALVGHSGCGKSTSIGLITRLYQPEIGEIFLDGVNIKELNIHWLRNVVGVVQQEPALFNDTIEENLKIGFPDLSEADMVEACKMANAHDFIMKLPKTYKTVIGDGGVQLSGGQKQRIAIARTLARNPKVLLLDEATSALDAQSESVVQKALDNAAQGRTTIVIAHRLSTVRNADKIVVFEKGNIIEQGTHSELVAANGKYAQLVKAQQMHTEDDEEEEQEQLPDQSILKANYMRVRQISQLSDLSERSGQEAFMRSCIAGDSFRASYVSNFGDAVNWEGDRFAEDVKLQMEKDEEVHGGIMSIFRHAKGNYVIMFFAFLTAMIRGLEMPFNSVNFGMVYSAFENAGVDNEAMMRQMGIAMILFGTNAIMTFVFHTLASVLFGRLSENLSLKFRVETFNSVLHQDAAYFDNPAHAPGRIITRLASDAPNVKAVVDGRMMYVALYLTSWIFCIVVSVISQWQLGLLGLGMSLALGTALIRLSILINRKNTRLAKKNPAGKFAIEIIENVRTIQLLTREVYFFKKFEQASKWQKRDEMCKGIFEAASFSLTQTFIYFTLGCLYALGCTLLYNDPSGYSAMQIYRSVLSGMLCSIAIMQSSSFFNDFVKAGSAAGMMFTMMKRKPTTGDDMQGEKPSIRGNVLFDDVHFVYPQRPHHLVYRGLQFTAQKGQTIALVGPSGSGKSTAISLIERFYDTSSGSVRFDGLDLRKISLHHLRTQVALVAQEPRLFAGTIRENVCFGLENVPDSDVRNALEIANAKSFVDSMPQGLDTEVGEKGTQLSGGQKQRIAIARALVRNPSVLLLDEATSALDSESERAVQEALDRAREGRTCITIAHRLSSIKNADLIVYIENGTVRESGTHFQLMERKGRYYRLVKKQDLST